MVALITGGSSGIGFSLAKKFAEQGYDIVLVATNLEKLNNAKSTLNLRYPDISVKIIQKDLTILRSCNEIFDLMQIEKTNIDVLINAAGYGAHGYFFETDAMNEEKMIDLNVKAVVRMTKLFLKQMKTLNRGTILNVGSTAGMILTPKFNIYGSTKAFVNHFTISLAEELKGTKIKVAVLCPPAVDTGFAASAGMEDTKLYRNKKSLISPDFVAEETWKMLQKNKTVIIPGGWYRLLFKLSPLAPRWVKATIVKSYLD